MKRVLLSLMLIACTGCGIMKNGAASLPLPGGPDAGDNPVSLTLHFASVEGLVPKSSVRFHNVTVGEVTDISVDKRDWTAVVTADVRGDTGLPDNAVAKVRRSSLLGEWFVELDTPEQRGAAPLRSGAVIPLASTSASAPVERVLGALSLLLNNGGLPQLNAVVTELNKAFGGNENQIRALLGDLDEFTTSLDDNKDGIVQALDGLAELSSTLEDNKQQIATTLDELPDGIEVLADQRKDLVRMLRSLDRLSDTTVHVVRASKNNTVADLKLLAPILRKLAQAGADLPEALKILVSFPFTPGAMGATRGDYVNLDAKIDFDLQAALTTLAGGAGPEAFATETSPKPASDGSTSTGQPGKAVDIGKVTAPVAPVVQGLVGGLVTMLNPVAGGAL